MNVYVLLVFYGEDQIIVIVILVIKVDLVKIIQIMFLWSILGVFMKEMNFFKINYVVFINDLVLYDKMYGSVFFIYVLLNMYYMIVDKVLKVFFYKFFYKVVNKNKYSRKWRDDDNKECFYYYENVNDVLKLLSNVDLDRFVDYVRLCLMYRQNFYIL